MPRERPQMRGWLAVISLAVFVASLPWLFMAWGLPDRVGQDVTLLSYEHEGRFDYMVHLKPSDLFGPPPEQPPPNPKYPAEIIDSIDFAFSYSPAEPGPEVARIYAVLENPGLWRKNIELVPDTSADGDFTLRFSLDIGEVQQLFDEVEEELKITSSTRNLTLVANVTGSKEQFVHQLPIKLSKSLIEVAANLRPTQASGVGEFDYAVNLKENSIFDSRTLKPPPAPETSWSATQKPGEVIFTRLVNRMDATFYYQFKSDPPASKVTTDVTITAVLDATGLWSKKFSILTASKGGDFDISFPVELTGYLELFDTVRAQTGASGESNTVTISADVHTLAETPLGLIEETFGQAMVGTLRGNVLDWDKELAKSQPGSIKEARLVPNPNKYLVFSVAGARILSTALAGIFLLCFVASLVLYVRSRPAELSWIEKEVARAKKKYGGIMAEATIEDDKTLSVGSMQDLLRVASELGKPIMHQAPAGPREPHAYYVFDGATRYRYVLRGKQGDGGGTEQRQ
ncbi:MAG: DUF5305 domain-containing protein [Chloroflexi bacterium]|nr:DUF5305 domain-containing protein [Chloroflexota bacterium]